MSKVVAAVWNPDPAALDRWRSDGAVVRRALADQGRLCRGSPFDALLTATIDDPDACPLDELGGRVWAWAVDERRPRTSADECAVTMVALMRRNPELTADQFQTHWTTRHAPLALVHHAGLADYTQNLVVRSLVPGPEQIDGVAELGFLTREAFETQFYDSDDGRRVIGEDVRRFMTGPGPETTIFAPPD
jgi:uncharacterized protein (TIGR02118 family)